MNWLVNSWMAIATFVRAARSPFIKSPAHRILFLLIIVGVLLICTLPEAAFVLPVLDSVGLDIVTIFAALELGHYVAFLARLAGEPASVDGLRRAGSPLVSGMIAPTNPRLWPYACLWAVVAFRIVMGTIKVSPQAQG